MIPSSEVTQSGVGGRSDFVTCIRFACIAAGHSPHSQPVIPSLEVTQADGGRSDLFTRTVSVSWPASVCAWLRVHGLDRSILDFCFPWTLVTQVDHLVSWSALLPDIARYPIGNARMNLHFVHCMF